MSLIDALAASPTGHRGRPCEFGRWLASLPEDEAAAVRAALADPSKSQDWIATRITAEGYPVSGSTIRNHRRNACLSCR